MARALHQRGCGEPLGESATAATGWRAKGATTRAGTDTRPIRRSSRRPEAGGVEAGCVSVPAQPPTPHSALPRAPLPVEDPRRLLAQLHRRRVLLAVPQIGDLHLVAGRVRLDRAG